MCSPMQREAAAVPQVSKHPEQNSAIAAAGLCCWRVGVSFNGDHVLLNLGIYTKGIDCCERNAVLRFQHRAWRAKMSRGKQVRYP